MSLNKHFSLPVVISLVFGLLASYFSVGYFHLDEHYQILEFLSFKLDSGNRSSLPWEFDAQIRPWIQPFVYYYLTKFFNLFGFNDPFVLEKIFRLSSVILFQFSIWKLYQFFVDTSDGLDKIKDNKEVLKWFFALFWVFPFLSARISSETVGASIFFIGAIELFKSLENKKIGKVIFASFLLGISVWIRFQLGAAVLGILLWYFFFSKKFNLKYFFMIVSGGILAVFLGIAIDFWGYGELVITPIKYFSRNILEGEAAKHGVQAWWEYFYVAQKKLHAGFGLFVVFSYLIFWFKGIKHYFALPMLLFYFLHMLTSHKELRFLYPMAYLIPFLLLYAFCNLKLLNGLKPKLKKGIGFTLLIYFTIGSIISSTKAQYQGVNLLKYIRDAKIETVYTYSTIPMREMTHAIEQSYYGKNDFIEKSFKSLDGLNGAGEVFIASRGGQQALELQNNDCDEVFPRHGSFYQWLHFSRKFYKQDYYSIYRCLL